RPARGFHFGKQEFFCPELEHINRCAYADYQRDKVYLRTSPEVRRSLRRKQRRLKKPRRANQTIACGKPEGCPDCGRTPIHVFGRKWSYKLVSDLKFTPT